MAKSMFSIFSLGQGARVHDVSKISPPLYWVIWGFLGSFGLFSGGALAVSSDYISLVDTVAKQQPEALITQGLSSQSSATQSLANSWLSDSVNLTVMHENDALTDDLDTQNWAMGVEFSLLLPSQKEALQGVSEAYKHQMSVQKRYLNWLASGKLRQLAWHYAKVRIALNLADAALQKSLELQDNVLKKVEVGEGTQLEVFMAEKFVLEQQAQVSQKKGELELAQNQWQLWTGTVRFPEIITEKHQLDWSPQEHPKLQWMQSMYEVAKAEYVQQTTQNKVGPSIFMGAQNDQNRVEENSFLFIEISVPLGESPSNRMDVAEKKYAEQAQKSELLRVRRELDEQVLAAEQTVVNREVSRNLAIQQNKIAQGTLKLAEQAYQLGETSIQSLLLIQKEALEAQLNLELAYVLLEEAIAQSNHIKGYALRLTEQEGK